MNSAIDPTRLYTILIKTGLQTKDPNLYQLLYNLIGNVVKLGNLTAGTGGGSGGGGGTTNVINNITNLIESLGDHVTTQEVMMLGTSGGGGGTTNNFFTTINNLMAEEIYIEENYFMPSPPPRRVYDSVLTNGDPLTPEVIFDSFGDVVMVTEIPL